MSIVITALALAAVQPAMAAPQPPAKAPGMQHSKDPASAAKGEGCCGCCKKMEGGKMGGSKEHGEGQAGEHSDHAAHQ